MPRRDLEQPRTIYNLNEIVEGGDRQYDVGVLVAPDETDPFVYHPYTFKKTISLKRNFEIHGFVTINDEEVFDTPTYCYGLEAIEDCQKRLAKLQVGEGVVNLKVVDEPIVLVPEQPKEHSWSRDNREYHPVPSDWFNLTTKAGRQFFESETKEWNTPWKERWERRGDSYYEKLNKHKFGAAVNQHVLWSSTDTPEQNYDRIVELLTRYGVKFKDTEIRLILGLPVAAAA